ncbi:MAG: hypothetical protein U9Q76_00465 [candidate division WOR-3 bacterium]|nr:hypothetical protein [candidate division WOR-3 bacterium]
MKRVVVRTGLMVSLALLLVAISGCDLFEGVNKIEYPFTYRLYETPGSPVSLIISLEFFDETPDTDGVDHQWELRGDTIWTLLKGNNEGDEVSGSHSNVLPEDIGALENGNYTLLFEDKDGEQDAFVLAVKDSIYLVEGEGEEVALYYGTDTLHRLFENMLLLEMAYDSSQAPHSDSLKEALTALGAAGTALEPGFYSIFSVDSQGEVAGARITGDPGYLDAAVLFTYDGDTTELANLYEAYKDDIAALSIRTGSGFDRYNWE